MSNLKGVRKPREPRWKAMTGGTLSYGGREETVMFTAAKAKTLSGGTGDRLNTWKSEDAYSKVPSPPRQMIKSTRLEMSSRSRRLKTTYLNLIKKK